MDFGSLQAFASTAADLHSSDNGARVEIALFVWVVVKKFTRPITVAVQSLVQGHKENSTLIESHTSILSKHSERIENHEKRIVVLEVDQTKGE